MAYDIKQLYQIVYYHRSRAKPKEKMKSSIRLMRMTNVVSLFTSELHMANPVKST